MSLTHPKSLALGVLLLTVVYAGPLTMAGLPPFSTHMLAHMLTVAVSAPLLVRGIAGSSFDPVLRLKRMPSAVVFSMVEFVAVWAWHAPALHDSAREHVGFYLLEQLTFLVCGVALWSSAWGGRDEQRRERAPGGAIGLLLTSMHMTLLGALIALSPRSLYAGHAEHASVSLAHPAVHDSSGPPVGHDLFDQHLGGALMILVGASSYLMGGLLLAKSMLEARHSTEDPA